LTKTQNIIKAALRKIKDKQSALAFCGQSKTLAEELRQKYYDIVEKELQRF
jgi:SRSO17 transposase